MRARSRRPTKERSHHWLLRFSLISLIIAATATLLGTGATIGIVDYFAGDLPSIDAIQTANLSQTTRILDRNGNLIEALYHENRTVVPLDKISLYLQRATIATEDRTFYDNSGVDYRRLAIAILYDLTHRTSAQGGSTITQQVVKNDVLDTEEAQSRTISRKFRELLLAEEMERRYTKRQILELYLNTINYGNGAYGAEAAAETYFRVHASELSWAQASFLAGLPQAPSDYDPFGTSDELDASRARWRQVLDGLVTVGDLSRTQADQIYGSDLVAKMVAARKLLPAAHSPLTAHFVDYVVQYVKKRYGEQALYEGGLTITTTLDLGTQAMADKWVKAGVRTYAKRGVNTGAMLVQQRGHPRPDQPHGHGPVGLARGRLVVQGLHVRGRAAGRAGHARDAVERPDRSDRRAHVQRLGRQARGLHHDARRARAVAQPAGAVDVLAGGRRPRGLAAPFVGRERPDREPGGRVDDARP
ncbi:MAG: hypothetical protein E6J28_09450 [Chloroflexi bacterium]|nr:MAG: hypothetical protein E6J28_09450 [Chloroflexota bacterium]